MKKLLTICLTLTMLSMPSNVNGTVTTTVATASSGISRDGVRVISEGRLNRLNHSEDVEFFNQGSWIMIDWGVPTGGCPGDVTYLWQQSSDGRTWTNAPGVNTERTYTTPPITDDIYFRRLTTDDCGVTFSTISVRITLDRTIWATRNVGMPGTFVDNPQDPGRLYQWNRRTPSWAMHGDITGWIREGAPGTTWARENDPCPEGWRVPTVAEARALERNATQFAMDGLNIIGIEYGSYPNAITVPYPTTRDADGFIRRLWNPNAYWTSEAPATRVMGMRPDVGYAYVWLSDGGRTSRSVGLPVRCVAETITPTPQQPTTPPTQTTSTSDDGVVINGVRWATRNVDAPGTFAATPESAGMFFQWNRRRGWAATGVVTGWDYSKPAGTSWTRENDPCPAGWRVPTALELYSLGSIRGEVVYINDVRGSLVPYGSNAVFIPHIGVRRGAGSPINQGSIAYLWSSDAGHSSPEPFVFPSSDNVGVGEYAWSATHSLTSFGGNIWGASGRVHTGTWRSDGLSVRCVAE